MQGKPAEQQSCDCSKDSVTNPAEKQPEQAAISELKPQLLQLRFKGFCTPAELDGCQANCSSGIHVGLPVVNKYESIRWQLQV